MSDCSDSILPMFGNMYIFFIWFSTRTQFKGVAKWCFLFWKMAITNSGARGATTTYVKDVGPLRPTFLNFLTPEEPLK